MTSEVPGYYNLTGGVYQTTTAHLDHAAGVNTFNNSGTIVKSDEIDVVTIEVPFSNEGLLRVNTGRLRFDAGVQNSGNIQIAGERHSRTAISVIVESGGAHHVPDDALRGDAGERKCRSSRS